MKKYTYLEPVKDDEGYYIIGENVVTMTEEEIIRDYWPKWREEMIAKNGPGDYDYQECINDWIVVHWAEEVKE